MFKINDKVMYAGRGACTVTDIRSCSFCGMPEQEYYVLNPIYENGSTVYVPVDRAAQRLRKLLTRDEALALIASMPDTDSDWITDDGKRKAAFTEILQSGNHTEIIGALRSLYANRLEKAEQGRKFHAADAEAMSSAEKILYSEFALALDIPLQEVGDFIQRQLQQDCDGNELTATEA